MMIFAVLIARLCRDETLTEEEKTRRINNVTNLWLKTEKFLDEEGIDINKYDLKNRGGYKDKDALNVIKIIVCYDYLFAAYYGKDKYSYLIDNRVQELVDIVLDAQKEAEETVIPIFDELAKRIN